MTRAIGVLVNGDMWGERMPRLRLWQLCRKVLCAQLYAEETWDNYVVHIFEHGGMVGRQA